MSRGRQATRRELGFPPIANSSPGEHCAKTRQTRCNNETRIELGLHSQLAWIMPRASHLNVLASNVRHTPRAAGNTKYTIHHYFKTN